MSWTRERTIKGRKYWAEIESYRVPGDKNPKQRTLRSWTEGGHFCGEVAADDAMNAYSLKVAREQQEAKEKSSQKDAEQHAVESSVNGLALGENDAGGTHSDVDTGNNSGQVDASTSSGDTGEGTGDK